MSIMNEIKHALTARLATIKASNGYQTDLARIFDDKIPLGMALEPHELPAILLIAGKTKIDPKGQNRAYKDWLIYLQLIHGDVEDSVMNQMVADIAQCIYANHPTADRADDFRTIHPSIYDIQVTDLDPDLNMIEANRFYIIELTVRYITKYNQF